MQVSVVICSHNPRPDYLRRVLGALKVQTLPKEEWELLLIDNASKEVLANHWDLSWHPDGRHVREEELGLTLARLRGFKESRGELFVFVDDDNVLAENYLEQALRIAYEWPMLGTWGGSITPAFEIPPPVWIKRYLGWLSVREVAEDKWFNLKDQYGTMPYGAGMCVRRTVVVEYMRRIASDPLRSVMDRRGIELLTAGSDIHLTITACEVGFGTGLFKSLKMEHLISANRLTEDHVVRLLEGMAFTPQMLAAARGQKMPSLPWSRRMRGYFSALRRGWRDFGFYRASVRGARNGLRAGKRWRMKQPAR